MIQLLLTYNIKVALLMAAFCLCYQVLMARDTHHRMKRWLLLATAMGSFVLPWCVITLHKTVAISPNEGYGGVPTSPLEGVSALSQPSLGEWLVGHPWVMDMVFAVWLVGVCLCLMHMLVSMVKVMALIRGGERHEVSMDDGGGKCRLVVVESDIPPFTWMRTVVLGRDDYEREKGCFHTGGSALLAHERGHALALHSIDTMVVYAITALQWFNPAAWLLRKELRTVHELEADARVISQGFNAYQYLNLLILRTADDAGYSIACGISTGSTLKKRVSMMLRKKQSKHSWARMLYVLPIIVVSLAVSARTVVDYQMMESQPTSAPDDAGKAFKLTDRHHPHVSHEGKTWIIHKPVTVEGVNSSGYNVAVSDHKLVIVDGVEVPEDALKELDQASIVSIDVLREESGRKHYGEKGANGVIIVTTNKGDANDPVYDKVEKLPEYPGGFEKLYELINANLVKPETPKGLQGRVVVRFVVEKDGSLSQFEVLKSVAETYDAEAIRVLKLMPKWTPARDKGKVVRCRFIVPVTYRN